MSSEQANITKFIVFTIYESESNNVIFSNQDDDPMELVLGEGTFFPKIEEKLQTMSPGDKDSMVLPPADAFGDHNDEAVQTIPTENLAEDVRKPGMEVLAQASEEAQFRGVVVSVNEQDAVIDFNHPYAGKDIKIDFAVVAKPKTEEPIDINEDLL